MNPKTEAPEGIKNHCDREFLNIYSPSSNCDDERDRNIFINGYFSSYDLLWPQIEMLKEALEEVIEMSKYVDNDRELRQYAKEALDRLKEIEG